MNPYTINPSLNENEDFANLSESAVLPLGEGECFAEFSGSAASFDNLVPVCVCFLQTKTKSFYTLFIVPLFDILLIITYKY